MQLRRFALTVAIMAVAAVMMLLTAPLSGALSGAISVGLDSLLGTWWEIVPILSLAPLVLTFIIYFFALMGVVIIVSSFKKEKIATP